MTRKKLHTLEESAQQRAHRPVRTRRETATEEQNSSAKPSYPRFLPAALVLSAVACGGTTEADLGGGVEPPFQEEPVELMGVMEEPYEPDIAGGIAEPFGTGGSSALGGAGGADSEDPEATGGQSGDDELSLPLPGVMEAPYETE